MSDNYATVEEVASLFRDLELGENAAVSVQEVEQYLSSSTEMINARLSTVYLLPITQEKNPQSFLILKRAQMFDVASIIDDVLNTYSESDKKPQWARRFESMMKQIAPPNLPNGKQAMPDMKLPDAVFTGTTEQKNTIRLNPTSGAVFKKGEDNW